MRTSKILLVSLPLVLAGCFDSDGDSIHYHPQPAPVVVATPSTKTPAVVKRSALKPQKAPDCGCGHGPDTVSAASPCPNPAICPPIPVTASGEEWHPSEGLLVRAGDLVMELQAKNGGVRPSHAVMSVHIQKNMGLTSPQAEAVLEELGL
ncbi:MAG: hypothetical protein FJX03_01025 [Alphaproteobacteria bacterium]|nr:hypothetical protein [Alphaproteobacteria bacterium]